MRFQYTYRTTAAELWKLSMNYTYGSMVGVCNILFTAGAVAVTTVYWGTAPAWQRVLMIVALLLFPVIQPLAVYGRARKQASGIKEDTTITIDAAGVLVAVGKQRSQLPWSSIKRVSKKPGMVIIFSDTTHGFVLTNRVLGKEKEDVYQYVASRIKK